MITIKEIRKYKKDSNRGSFDSFRKNISLQKINNSLIIQNRIINIKNVSKYTESDLLRKYKDWGIIWNHTEKHDILDRINKRTKSNVIEINEKIIDILNSIKNKEHKYISKCYLFSFTDVKYKIVIDITLKTKSVYIGTILNSDMVLATKIEKIII